MPERRDMTQTEALRAEALSHCVFLPGSNIKRFVRSMSQAAYITDKQAEYLEDVAWMYRVQLRKLGHAGLVPIEKPIREKQAS